jgi:soluble lytic murein transglycosylase
MSSMPRISLITLTLSAVVTASAPLAAEDQAAEWDRARANLVASTPGQMAQAVDRWQQLTASNGFAFSDYAGFLLRYPGFPDQEKLQASAEARLATEAIDNGRLVAYFDQFPPVTNPARAQYALALAALGRPQAAQIAREAWRGGQTSDVAAASLYAQFGNGFSQADHDARMDALLWQRQANQAAQQLGFISAARRPVFMARLAILQGGDGATADPSARSDPGYLYNRSRELRTEGRAREALDLLAVRPKLASEPFDREAWVTELLSVARMGGASHASRIAASVDDAFAPGTDISGLGYKLRDDYTSLVWLGGTKALWELADARAAAPLFYRYGAAAKTGQTKSKGFYWAGLASQRAGDAAGAQRYFEMAAEYPERFYGQLALEKLGRPLPNLASRSPSSQPSSAERAAFYAKPITTAVREASRAAPWRVKNRFFREISDQATSEGEHVLVVELARDIGRRDLAVIAGEAASSEGIHSFGALAYPTLVTPPGTNWTLVHAISRQETQFAQDAISHAGARGIMQLMPGTAREEAGKAGIQYLQASLLEDASYNIRLGNNYFERQLAYYNGSYPLAVAAYNAGPGNVNKWLRANGDPRTSGMSWEEWIERIPIYETKNYVQRVLENAVVYEAMYPDKTPYGTARPLSRFLR